MRPIIVDTYEGDGVPNVDKLVTDARFAGIVVKATEGTYYHGADWFRRAWRRARDLRALRPDFRRGAYHFLKFNLSGRAQADFFLKMVDEAAGYGFQGGDFLPVVDVEQGGEENTNRHTSKQQVIDCTSAFAARIRKQRGLPTILYGGTAMYDLGITSRMGCEWIWVARYTDSLPEKVLARIGWTPDRLAMWQYVGDNKGGGLTDEMGNAYPVRAPGLAQADLSVAMNPLDAFTIGE